MLQDLLDHLKTLSYTQVSEAHSIRFKVSEIVKDKLLARRVNDIRFNTWFLDPEPKRKKQFEQAKKILISIIENQLEIKRMKGE